MIATRCEWRIMTWWPSEERNGNNSWNAPGGKKRILTIKNNYERMASSLNYASLEERVRIKRNSSSVFKIQEWRRETPPNCWETPEGLKEEKVEPKPKRVWKILEKDIWLMTNHYYVNLWNEFRIAPVKLEESGKILGKDLWVRSHSR